MALMEAKVSHGNKQAWRHGEGREVWRGRGFARIEQAKRDGYLEKMGGSEKTKGFFCIVLQRKGLL